MNGCNVSGWELDFRRKDNSRIGDIAAVMTTQPNRDVVLTLTHLISGTRGNVIPRKTDELDGRSSGIFEFEEWPAGE
jgi:hypothetical protein